MKFGFLVVIALIVSAFAAHILLQDPGYVVINFRGYLVEMSVPVLAGRYTCGRPLDSAAKIGTFAQPSSGAAGVN